ncbi:MAG TPA: NADH-quinone oxidoreductase subunit NuoG [Bryobacteraceae bacterium]|nr:NADH-quinone oxidoreductase subunit NuoG [Bryobacteraceae bacterium]HOL72725.1 NADH-quinone oxidoreductase subunit NuoG [Bryobacteraceae bacterium]HOQ44752.1 NADH-quinone oxidoreductase subunit NuoG [Bryobacteraceae bacterium]HPU71962.1 NADH-quinone oxidoreductase subunit NuoG [Bryobacteraceae bacterium]
MANVKLTIDGKTVEAPANTLLIEAARRAGIEIPAFCYYEGLALQAACRMCLVEVEKAPKLMTACTLPVAEGMVVRTNTPQVAQARKSMLEFVLTNHPLDCPVCDKGGECELQDMVFRYGAGESRFLEVKQHVDEREWSPVVFYDRPRCILCFRCVRICAEGMGVAALGVVNRGASSEIAPNRGDHLECDECGMCIDICPVGALTSGTYRYRTRPWEMQHVGTICTHCADGCKTTLGIRNNRIHRGNNRDRSGVNGEFLCIKGRYAGDFAHHEERLLTPLVRSQDGFKPVSWAEAIKTVAGRFAEIRQRGGKFGVIGSNHTTNEENYYLQKLARTGLGTNNIDHHRTGDVLSLLRARVPLATTADLYHSKAVLIVGVDLAQQHSFLAYQIRANWRHHQARVYTVRRGPVREDKIAARIVSVEPGGELAGVETLRDDLAKEPELVILFGDAIQGEAVARLTEFGSSLGIPVKYVCLVDYSNSRGAVEMGVLPAEGGMTLPEMMAAGDLDALWVVGANPLRRHALAGKPFLVVQDLFLTETAQAADVVLPAASAYEKSGTVTNVCGEVQRLQKAFETPGTKTDLEIFGLIAREMGLDLKQLGPWTPSAVFAEIARTVPGYDLPVEVLEAGGAVQAGPSDGLPDAVWAPVQSAGDTLFTSGTLGRYSKMLNAVREAPGELYRA